MQIGEELLKTNTKYELPDDLYLGKYYEENRDYYDKLKTFRIHHSKTYSTKLMQNHSELATHLIFFGISSFFVLVHGFNRIFETSKDDTSETSG